MNLNFYTNLLNSSIFLKESCFPYCWKVSSLGPVFKNVGERSTAKNYHPVSLLFVVSKVFEKLVNKRIVDHLEKCGLFSDFQYGFRFSRSTADLLFLLFSVIDRFRWFWMRRLHKNIQLMLEFLKAPFFALHFSYNTLMNLLMILSVILLSLLMILLSTLSVI